MEAASLSHELLQGVNLHPLIPWSQKTDENPELRSAAIMIKIFVIPETTTSAGWTWAHVWPPEAFVTSLGVNQQG